MIADKEKLSLYETASLLYEISRKSLNEKNFPALFI
jgi:hypothetical protein